MESYELVKCTDLRVVAGPVAQQVPHDRRVHIVGGQGVPLVVQHPLQQAAHRIYRSAAANICTADTSYLVRVPHPPALHELAPSQQRRNALQYADLEAAGVGTAGVLALLQLFTVLVVRTAGLLRKIALTMDCNGC